MFCFFFSLFKGAHVPIRTVFTKKIVPRRSNPFKKPPVLTPNAKSDQDPEKEIASPDAVATTPAMRQYGELKQKYPGSILLFKLGNEKKRRGGGKRNIKK